MAAYLLCSLRSAAEEQPKQVPGLEAHVGGAEWNHAAPATHRDRCTAVGLPEDGSPDALSARQAYGKPPYHGPVAGRQAVAHGARRERRENTAQSAPESLQIAARTEKPLDLVTTTTSTPRQLSVEHLGGAWQAAAWRGTGSAPDGAARTKAPYLRLAPLTLRVA